MISETAATTLAEAVSTKGQRTAPGVDALAQSFLDNLLFVQGRSVERATVNDLYMALAHTVRDRLVERWISTTKNYQAQDVRVVCYLSAEFLTGPHLVNNLINLGIYEETEAAMRHLGLDLKVLIEQEGEPGLGNGGLGRLASCFMDSLATLDIPAIGYGIRYEYGIFDQQIRDGWQVESTDNWLRLGNPWALERPEDAVEVKLGGHTETAYGCARPPARAMDSAERLVRGVPTTRPSSATAPTPRTRCACGRPRPWRVRLRRASTTAIFWARSPTKSRPRTSPRFFIPTMRACGQAAAPGAAVLFRLLQPAAYSQDPDDPEPATGRTASQLCHPDERHPSRHRRGRADAAAD